MQRDWDHPTLLGEMKNATQNILAVPQKAKYSITHDPVIPFLGLYLKELKTRAQILVC